RSHDSNCAYPSRPPARRPESFCETWLGKGFWLLSTGAFDEEILMRFGLVSLLAWGSRVEALRPPRGQSVLTRKSDRRYHGTGCRFSVTLLRRHTVHLPAPVVRNRNPDAICGIRPATG